MHGVRVPMWQTQSAGPVRTANIMCCWLWTLCHTTQHGPVLIIYPINLQTITITRSLGCCLAEGRGSLRPSEHQFLTLAYTDLLTIGVVYVLHGNGTDLQQCGSWMSQPRAVQLVMCGDVMLTRCWSRWESLWSWRIVSSLAAMRSLWRFCWSVKSDWYVDNWLRHVDSSAVVSASCCSVRRHSRQTVTHSMYHGSYRNLTVVFRDEITSFSKLFDAFFHIYVNKNMTKLAKYWMGLKFLNYKLHTLYVMNCKKVNKCSVIDICIFQVSMRVFKDFSGLFHTYDHFPGFSWNWKFLH